MEVQSSIYVLSKSVSRQKIDDVIVLGNDYLLIIYYNTKTGEKDVHVKVCSIFYKENKNHKKQVLNKNVNSQNLEQLSESITNQYSMIK